MTEKFITQEQFDNDDFPQCDRCSNYENAHSSVYGDCWTCAKGHCSVDVNDNGYNIATTGVFKIIDCGNFNFGTPINYNLG